MKIETIHKKMLTKVFDKATLNAILRDLVLKEAGERFDPRTDACSVDFREVTEGSPGYHVGYSAVVSLTLDQGHKAADKADDE